MRRSPSRSPPRRQRGLALLVLLALFAMAAAYMLVSSLNKSSVALSQARADKNRDVLQQAKAALIAWSAAQVLQSNVPGALPCPDINNDGVAEPTCSSSQRLGRLPYLTLGIDDLRDASGERLWYAMSGNFRSSSTINSDKQGTLTISGLAPASNAVAVVLAPGMAVMLPSTGLLQNRSPSGTSCNSSGQACNTASNYLEDINGDTNTTDYITATENLTNPSILPYPFNDQLLVITQQDLLSAIEPLVAARIKRDIVAQYIYNNDPTLTDSGNVWSDNSSQRDRSRYYDAWGGFPFAAPFINPGSSSFTGQAGTYEGLLPMVGSLSYTWSSGTIAKAGGGGSPSCFPANGGSDLICSITYGAFSAPTIHMTGTVPNVGLSFVQLPQLVDVSISSGSLSARTLTGSLNSAGAGIVILDATLPFNGSFSNKTVSIDINNSSLLTSPLISTGDAFAGWFNSKQWYKQTYYAVSPGYTGGNTNCNVTNPCLSVYNLPAPYANPTTNTEAILIFAGSSLSGATRPNGTLSDYLEGQNASTGDYSFEHSLGKTTTVAGAPAAINDRVIVIAP